MARRAEAYVDTSALISFVDRSDTYHPLFRRLFENPPPLVTTALVIAEAHAWFLRRYDRSRALKFLGLIDDMTPLSVLGVGPRELPAAGRTLRRFPDQDLTLADAVGLYVMTDRGAAICWSTDFHLGLAGVPLVINQV